MLNNSCETILTYYLNVSGSCWWEKHQRLKPVLAERADRCGESRTSTLRSHYFWKHPVRAHWRDAKGDRSCRQRGQRSRLHNRIAIGEKETSLYIMKKLSKISKALQTIIYFTVHAIYRIHSIPNTLYVQCFVLVVEISITVRRDAYYLFLYTAFQTSKRITPNVFLHCRLCWYLVEYNNQTMHAKFLRIISSNMKHYRYV